MEETYFKATKEYIKSAEEIDFYKLMDILQKEKFYINIEYAQEQVPELLDIKFYTRGEDDTLDNERMLQKYRPTGEKFYFKFIRIII